MNNVNDFKYAELLKQYQAKVLAPQIKRRADAQSDFEKVSKGTDREAIEVAKAKVGNYDAWLKFYEQFYDEGLRLCTQHESLTNKMSKIYDRWYSDISNEGKQEIELMSSQADLLCELMGELYKELLPLNLPGMKPPSPLNMK
jgi:hypothetical protein